MSSEHKPLTIGARRFTARTNASLATIAAGFKALGRIDYPAKMSKVETSDRVYFLFPNGQLRRELGEGHSADERAARRDRRIKDYASRREYKRGR